MRAPADDDLHLVAARDEVLADDLAARRVPHAFADDAVEDAHSEARLSQLRGNAMAACTSGTARSAVTPMSATAVQFVGIPTRKSESAITASPPIACSRVGCLQRSAVATPPRMAERTAMNDEKPHGCSARANQAMSATAVSTVNASSA